MGSMTLTGAPTCSLQTSAALPGIIDEQLREAAWSTMARMRQLAEPKNTVAHILRQEHALRGHMAGLASVYNGRLSRRLQRLLVEPEELATEVFVAGLLLLRCDRANMEQVVYQAWVDSPCALQRRYLGQAMVHGGLTNQAHQTALLNLLTHHDATLRQAAGEVVGAMGLFSPTIHAAVCELPQNDDAVLGMKLRLMTHGVWPLDSHCLAVAMTHANPDVTSALEHVLALRCPEMLVVRTRARIDNPADCPPTLLGLEAMAATLNVASPQGQADLIRLQSLCSHGRIAPLALQALALTGLTAATTTVLQALSQSPTEASASAALHTFTMLTGIQENESTCAPDGHAWSDEHRAEALHKAWQNKGSSFAQDERLFFGQPQSASRYLQHLPRLSVGRWHSMMRMIAMRSVGTLILPTWPLIERHRHQVVACSQAIDAALRMPKLVTVKGSSVTGRRTKYAIGGGTRRWA